mmetsp:Transcript_49516/g.149226  ORF Transcript_49516/g.149226 Transcript_49516/m.149226 type:complete len:217 (-) Transcript_49516:309-959(-)
MVRTPLGPRLAMASLALRFLPILILIVTFYPLAAAASTGDNRSCDSGTKDRGGECGPNNAATRWSLHLPHVSHFYIDGECIDPLPPPSLKLLSSTLPPPFPWRPYRSPPAPTLTRPGGPSPRGRWRRLPPSDGGASSASWKYTSGGGRTWPASSAPRWGRPSTWRGTGSSERDRITWRRSWRCWTSSSSRGSCRTFTRKIQKTMNRPRKFSWIPSA